MNSDFYLDHRIGVAAVTHNDGSMNLCLYNPERTRELQWAINRALNCAPEAPRWLFDFVDLLERSLKEEPNA